VGENRVQELETKFDGLKGRFEIHFIGHLQTNKAKKAAVMADWIHSVDSLRLAQALDRACASLGKKPRVLIEVNTSGETQKYGAPPEMLPELLNGTASLRNLEVSGLMTMAMLTDNPEKARACFRFLRELRDRAAAEGLYRLSELSMGMSQDYEIAVEEGATLVRVGTALFN
jgi:pyridoxal phosphate enzyme (YggS family)